MRKILLRSIYLLTIMTVVTGGLYPLAVTFVSQLLFASKANGSLITESGRTVGSELLAQKFLKPEYFWPRPSAADFATVPSGASNFGPTNQKLKDRLLADMKKYGINENSNSKPFDLLLTSASGLDPHLRPESVLFQIPRVAKARNLNEGKIYSLVAEFVEKPTLGIFGRPRVNVLKLNLALDKLRE
jgi:K+-transporting ATPase ATPase C chain